MPSHDSGGADQAPADRAPSWKRDGSTAGSVLVAVALQRRERDAAPFPDALGLGPVDEDAEDPGLERRAALEPVDPVEDAEPRLLDDVLGRFPRGHVGHRQPQQRRVVPARSARRRPSRPPAGALRRARSPRLWPVRRWGRRRRRRATGSQIRHPSAAPSYRALTTRTSPAVATRPRSRSGRTGRRATAGRAVTSPAMATVAEWSRSAVPGPVKVAPTMTRRSSSITRRLVPRKSLPATLPPATPPVGWSTTFTVEAPVPGLGLGEADGGDLRVGEGDPGDDVAAGPVPGVLAEDHVAGDAGLVLAHVGEEREAVAVADGVEPAAADTLGLQPVVDLDRLAGFEADGVEPEVGGVGRSADGDEDLVGFEDGAVLEAWPAVAPRRRSARRRSSWRR